MSDVRTEEDRHSAKAIARFGEVQMRDDLFQDGIDSGQRLWHWSCIPWWAWSERIPKLQLRSA